MKNSVPLEKEFRIKRKEMNQEHIRIGRSNGKRRGRQIYNLA